jgi:hypothetical protein
VLFRSITDAAASAPFPTRLVKLEEQFENASVLMHKSGVLPLGVWKRHVMESPARQRTLALSWSS